MKRFFYTLGKYKTQRVRKISESHTLRVYPSGTASRLLRHEPYGSWLRCRVSDFLGICNTETVLTMKKVAKAGCLISVFLMIGCAHIPFIGTSSQSAKETMKSGRLEPPLELNGFVVKGQIVDAGRLRQGKNIAVIPFKAGVGVEANEDLERIALMIVKGITDVFADDQGTSFNILTAENSKEADFVIQGHVTNVKGPSRVSRWVLRKGQKTLSVDGKMIDAQTGKAIAVFTDQVTSKTENYRDLGYRIGKDIGLYTLSGAD